MNNKKILYLHGGYGQNTWAQILQGVIRENARGYEIDIAISIENANYFLQKNNYKLIIACGTIDQAGDGAEFVGQHTGDTGSVGLVMHDKSSDPEFQASFNVDSPTYTSVSIVDAMNAYIALAIEAAEKRN